MLESTHMQPEAQKTSNERTELKNIRDGLGLFAAQDIATNEVVVRFEPRFLTAPSRMTIQVAEGKHLCTDHNVGAFVNHSCEPNFAFDADKLAFVAKHPIAKGEELSFNYLTTEWDMASPFDCECGSSLCVGRVAGARYLDGNARAGILKAGAAGSRVDGVEGN